MQVVCLDTITQETMRTVYLTEDKTVLIGDPTSYLLIVDSILEPTKDLVLLRSETNTGEETLIINNNGDASLIITKDENSSTMTMHCYTGKTNLFFNTSLLKNLK